MSKSRSRRWIVIGPGILLAVIFAMQIAIRNHQTTSAPPIVERQVIGSSMESEARPTPEIGILLANRDRLGLNARQVSALTKLKSKWHSESKPLTSEMDKAAAEFNRFMSKSKGKATMSDIQSHMAPVSELSRQVSSLRRVYWQKALQALNPKQREAANMLLQTHKETDR